MLAPGGWVFAMIPTLGVHRTDRDDEGWYEDTEVPGHEHRPMQWNLRRETWAAMFEDAGIRLVEGSLAAESGAHKAGVFFFGVKVSGSAGQAPEESPAEEAFRDLAHLASHLGHTLEPTIDAAAKHMAASLSGGGKILACGNGGSAADAQHFVAELVGRLRRERPSLPALSLSSDPSVVTAIGNDYGYDRVFARQVEGLGAAGDTLLAISTSGRSPNVIEALAAAREGGLSTVALLGGTGGPAAGAAETALVVDEVDTQRIQEAHTAILHALCESLERHLDLG